MATNDLAIRFTEEKYASKTDVMKDLGTSLVDNIWRNILNYRQPFNVRLSLHSFSNVQYVLCNSEMLKIKNQFVEEKLINILNKVNSILEEDFTSLEYQDYFNLLKYVAVNNSLDSSDVRMRAILKGEVKSYDKDTVILPNYLKALSYLKKHYNDDINLDFIRNLHRILNNGGDSSFRTKDDNDPSNRVLIDRIYTSAPVGLIESLITELIIFIKDNDLPSLYKTFIVYYAFTSIKPFTSYSRELAVLVAKTILARESMGEVGLLLPLEKLLIISKEEESRLFNDVQKYNDTTYFTRYAFELVDTLCSEYVDHIVDFTTSTIHEEFFQVDEEPTKVEEPVEEVIEEIEPTPIVEDVIETPKPVEKPKAKPKQETKEVVQEVVGEVAIRYIPKGLDEKEAAKLEKQLLEMDPSLRKKEAHFYAHHCTIGMNYTIQHFKRYCRVSYETARVGMDHLAELGYYRKEQFKNKFIYSPIKRD